MSSGQEVKANVVDLVGTSLSWVTFLISHFLGGLVLISPGPQSLHLAEPAPVIYIVFLSLFSPFVFLLAPSLVVVFSAPFRVARGRDFPTWLLAPGLILSALMVFLIAYELKMYQRVGWGLVLWSLSLSTSHLILVKRKVMAHLGKKEGSEDLLG